MQLRFLLATGPGRQPAELEFGPGLNVIYGGSNTGKSHVLRLIDYGLGASTPVEPIPEQVGYDLLHLGVVLDSGEERTLVRALQGGDIRILDGLQWHRPSPTEGVAVAAKHSAKTSLSKLLLAALGAEGARIRTDASGKTRDLSFRDLNRNVLIQESKIQDPLSPVHSGQYVTKTAETSVFKYLLTGVDDSALDLAKPDASQAFRQAAQLELLDRQIRGLDREIAEADQDHEELQGLDKTLDQQIGLQFSVQEDTEVAYRDLTGRRRGMRLEYEAAQDRASEIDGLEERFVLLQQHYASDVERLEAIVETGQFYQLETSTNCPICGSTPEDHKPELACEGDVDSIVSAAKAEIEEIRTRAADLGATLGRLGIERASLEQSMASLLPEIERVQGEILREVPSVRVVRAEVNALMQRKLSVQRDLDLVRRRDDLIVQRAELGISPGYDSSTVVVQQQLDGATLDAFCQVVEAELQSWQFPGAQRVFFETPKMDISVGGKSRAANGKGVRALLHAAFSISLMKFSRARGHQHPGFVALDSLFITYRDPSDAAESAIASTPLKDRAFKAFADMPDDYQLIVLENVDVPGWLTSAAQCTHFTGSPKVGRAGLFPPLS